MAIISVVRRFLQNISVEPALVLNMIAVTTFMVPYQIGLYQVVCQKFVDSETEDAQLYARIDCWRPDLGANSSDGKNASDLRHRLENRVQESTASWSMVFSMAYILPSIFSDIVMGAYGDSQGRKYNIILGILGTVISFIPWIIIFVWPSSTPLYVAIFGDLVSGFTGYLAIITISSAAYIADTVADSRQLTVRMTILAIVTGAASIVGPLIAKGIMSVTTYWEAGLVAAIIEVLTILYIVVRLKQVPPREMREIARLKAAGRSDEVDEYVKSLKKTGHESIPFVQKLKTALLSAVDLLKAVWHTFARKRPGNRRTYLLILSLAVFLSSVADAILSGMIMTLFVQKTPLLWDKNKITDFKAVSGAISLFGSTVGIFLFKKQFQLSDTFIILVSLISTIIRCVLMAFSAQDWMLYVASGTGTLAGLLIPCVQSFVAQIVDADEVGKSFVAFSVGTNMAFFANLMVFTAIYRATVSVFAGFVYLIAAGLLVIIFCLCAWVHVDVHGGWHGLCGKKAALIHVKS